MPDEPTPPAPPDPRPLVSRAGGVLSGGMAIALATVALIGGLGVLALVGLPEPTRGADALAGQWRLEGGLVLCMHPVDGARVEGELWRAGRRWTVTGERTASGVRATLGAGAAPSVAVGELVAEVAASGAPALGGVLRLTDPAAAVDLVVRFTPTVAVPVPASGCAGF